MQFWNAVNRPLHKALRLREFPTFSSSLLWKLLSRWWKWISVICRSRDRRQETYSPCMQEHRRHRKVNEEKDELNGIYFYCPSKMLLARQFTVISAVHWGHLCPLDVSTEWDLLMMDRRVCSSTSSKLSTIISTSSWTEDSWKQKPKE